MSSVAKTRGTREKEADEISEVNEVINETQKKSHNAPDATTYVQT